MPVVEYHGSKLPQCHSQLRYLLRVHGVACDPPIHNRELAHLRMTAAILGYTLTATAS